LHSSAAAIGEETVKSIFAAMFAGIVGCAFIHPVPAAGAAQFREKVLHSFGAAPDGEVPYAGAIDAKGTLYGTTAGGGGNFGGTVFALDLNTGTEKILYSFYDEPWASLIDVKGTLYGTTEGGDGGAGTVFAIDPNTGAEKTLHTFCSQSRCADGDSPVAGLIDVKGMLYGTTIRGGNTGCDGDGCGTVFSIDPNTGAEKVLYSFCSQPNCADGGLPQASLIDVNGTLYGTTVDGGGTGCGNDQGCGTVFSLDPKTGAETVLYTFCSQPNCVDGAQPHAALIDVNGTLYGTTYRGGSNTSCYESCGTVFSIDPNTGAETVLYSFCSQQNCADGANPLASVIDVNGTLYGTTLIGGATGCGSGGCGTVFSIDPNTGAETILHAFQDNGTDGTGPQGGLIDVNGKLYGTTDFGGTYGYGTVFVLKEKR
jgi:uncharacterized repeat protein (TIGR03803 family)